MSSTLPKRTRFNVLGIMVDAITLPSAYDAIDLWSRDNVGRFICVRDVHGVMQARRDVQLAEVHQEASLVTPDGMPLVWLGRWKGYQVGRTCGPDLLEYVVAKGTERRLRHYFYGGKPGVCERLTIELTRRNPELEIVGAATPPFEPLTQSQLEMLAAELNASRAHVIWIGLSSPKQELLMYRLAPITHATLIGVGAAFDFNSGTIVRAPRWMQRSGLEWLFRLASEPRRLWRRYLIMAPHFVASVAWAELANAWRKVWRRAADE